jgi:hypothetical protein
MSFLPQKSGLYENNQDGFGSLRIKLIVDFVQFDRKVG